MLAPRELALLSAVLERAVQRHGKEPLARIQAALDAESSGRKFDVVAHPSQRPRGLFVPGLSAEPWSDVAALEAAHPGLVRLREGTDEILAELRGLLDQQRGFQPFDEGEGGFTQTSGAFGWNVFYFHWLGSDCSRNQRLCPRTTELLRGVPGGLALQAYFSALQPGAHLERHCGPTNTILTVHLGLIVPQGGCGLRVLDETREWRRGELLVFNDSLPHEAWNRSDRTRFILLFDIWHPELTPIERSYLAEALKETSILDEQEQQASAIERHRDVFDGKRWWY